MNVVAKLRQRGKKDQPPKLLCDIKWLKNVVIFFFFLENAKHLWTTLNGEKKGDGLIVAVVLSKREVKCIAQRGVVHCF